jgi:hypothetical protein
VSIVHDQVKVGRRDVHLAGLHRLAVLDVPGRQRAGPGEDRRKGAAAVR